MSSFLRLRVLSVVGLLACLVSHVHSGALQVKTDTADNLLASNELVFMNFYANWCRFSQMLEPIFDEFADKVAQEYAGQPGKVAVGKVNCEEEQALAQANQINKYPTLKLYRHGVALKKEFRGARTVEAFLNYIKEQLATPIQIHNSYHNINAREHKKSAIIGYFDNEQSEAYKTFYKLAGVLRDSCEFDAGFGPGVAEKRQNGDNIVFRPRGTSSEADEAFAGGVLDYNALYAWANDKCTPVVREITFENAEELTEEGLPFLILFHRPEDTESVKLYEKEVVAQLAHQRNTINAVHADGNKFSHPLHHLGKSVADLPVLAIDSFRHMYLFSDFKKIIDGVSLNQFVMDLHSGKLHREFHNGPDPTEAPPATQPAIDMVSGHIPIVNEKAAAKKSPTTPPDSMFVKLGPSNNRYSLKHGGEL